ncbi:MAG TPA: YceD family protein, partial [Gammaproteobacteria bacterium]|nr:YceD family protein [Gammaproteobacteria bacterium]
CQRCLDDFNRVLEVDFRLGLVRSQEEAARLAHGYDPLLVTAEPALVADIVADEVLLALPFAPVHDDPGECHGLHKDYQPSDDVQRENPFAVLAGLKQKQKQ